MQRRHVLGAALSGALATSLPISAAHATATPIGVEEVVKPSKERPIIACFNENPLGLSAAAREAVAKSAAEANRYPFARSEVLRKACANFIGGKPEEIVLSQGSAEAIRASVEAFGVEQGATLIIPELTYSDGEMAAQRNNIPVVKVKMAANWAIDIPAMRDAAQKAAAKGYAIVYFVNPNNPTGTIADTQALFDWVRSRPANTIFLLDEAYAEFVADPAYKSGATLVQEGLENVIVLKTFSKLFGMAGLRLGFAYAAKATVARVHDHIAYDFFMNRPAIEAALVEMNDEAYIKLSRDENAEARAIMDKVLDELGLEHLPSQTNFCFFNLKAPLKPFADAMRAEFILVGRPFPPADGWCRLSFVRPVEMQYVADVMRRMRKEGRL